MLTDDFLDTLEDNQVPPHRLFLKENDIVFIMRNIDIENGITNNTRAKVIKIHPYRIIIELLGVNQGKRYVLPRIRFVFASRKGKSFEILRTQFPLRRAFAITATKAAGQTLKRVIADLRVSPFAHGLLYITLSRVQNPKDIILLVNTDLNNKDNGNSSSSSSSSSSNSNSSSSSRNNSNKNNANVCRAYNIVYEDLLKKGHSDFKI